jgi:predicted nucleic acid-binding protein
VVYPEEALIDDPDDRLLLRAAIHAGAVYLISGDDHFLRKCY